MMSFDEIFGMHRIMVILRGMPSTREALMAAGRAWDVGVKLLEIPIGELAHADILASVVTAGLERGMMVGAGTVVTTKHVQIAHEAGARYTIAPGFDLDVLNASRATGLPHLPGVATPSEVQRARAAGCQWVKVFPAGALGSEWLSAVRGPFPDVSYLATGGITPESADAYIQAGASIVAFGASLTAPERYKELATLVRKFDGFPISTSQNSCS
jgi:2-dehydro-3-deoxyphosphogluconate aldolase/(4S)-4-hydroxy-2-oxoglutarate aldolase